MIHQLKDKEVHPAFRAENLRGYPKYKVDIVQGDWWATYAKTKVFQYAQRIAMALLNSGQEVRITGICAKTHYGAPAIKETPVQ